MDKNTVLSYSNSILKRYEEPLNTIFLYNVKNDTIWAGNSEAFTLLALIDGQRSVEEITLELCKSYPDTDTESVFNTVFSICNSLHNKGIVTSREYND